MKSIVWQPLPYSKLLSFSIYIVIAISSLFLMAFTDSLCRATVMNTIPCRINHDRVRFSCIDILLNFNPLFLMGIFFLFCSLFLKLFTGTAILFVAWFICRKGLAAATVDPRKSHGVLKNSHVYVILSSKKCGIPGKSRRYRRICLY